MGIDVQVTRSLLWVVPDVSSLDLMDPSLIGTDAPQNQMDDVGYKREREGTPIVR